MLSKYKFLKIKLIRITFRCSSMDDVKDAMFHVSDMCMQCKVGKEARFWNRYNQVPLLTQDTVWEKNKYTKNIRYRRAKKSTLSQQVTTRLHDTDKTIQQTQTHKKDPQNNNRLGMVSKKITGGLKLVSQYQPHP